LPTLFFHDAPNAYATSTATELIAAARTTVYYSSRLTEGAGLCGLHPIGGGDGARQSVLKSRAAAVCMYVYVVVPTNATGVI
ncbi:unnamed protein product, partial [Ceratitis capitata]